MIVLFVPSVLGVPSPRLNQPIPGSSGGLSRSPRSLDKKGRLDYLRSVCLRYSSVTTEEEPDMALFVESPPAAGQVPVRTDEDLPPVPDVRAELTDFDESDDDFDDFDEEDFDDDFDDDFEEEVQDEYEMENEEFPDENDEGGDLDDVEEGEIDEEFVDEAAEEPAEEPEEGESK